MINGHWEDDCYVPEPSVQRFEALLGKILGGRPCDGCGRPLGNVPRRMIDHRQYHPECGEAKMSQRIFPDDELKAPVKAFENTFSGAEMLAGYLDGFKDDNPEPSGNRSHSYRHGFANGRDDRRRKPRDTAENLRKAGIAAQEADEALRKDGI